MSSRINILYNLFLEDRWFSQLAIINQLASFSKEGKSLLHVRINEEALRMMTMEVIESREAGSHSIRIARLMRSMGYGYSPYYPKEIIINPTTLLEGDKKIVADKFRETLTKEK